MDGEVVQEDCTFGGLFTDASSDAMQKRSGEPVSTISSSNERSARSDTRTGIAGTVSPLCRDDSAPDDSLLCTFSGGKCTLIELEEVSCVGVLSDAGWGVNPLMVT